MKILALDLGKFNTMCCFFDSKTRKHSFLNAANDRQFLATLFKKHKVDLVVMEACGPSGWICDLAQNAGHKTIVCPATGVLTRLRQLFGVASQGNV